MRILGIDFGLVKIGLAFADDSRLAQPLGILRNDQKALTKIVQLVEREEVEKVVIGISDGKVGRMAKNFGKKLFQMAGLKIVYRDETLTTKEALDKMLEAGKKKMYRQKKKDAFAAAIILQDYINAKTQIKLPAVNVKRAADLAKQE